MLGYSHEEMKNELAAYYNQRRYQKERKYKMTRQEAIKKIEISANRGYDAIPANNLVIALEALGLIKFEEEKIVDDLETVLKECRGAYNRNDEFIKALEKRGYEIVKREKDHG